jgi:hypothetical protein
MAIRNYKPIVKEVGIWYSLLVIDKVSEFMRNTFLIS